MLSITTENQIVPLEARGTFIDTGKLIDIALILTITLFAFLYHIGRIGYTYPLVTLGGDGAIIASWSAAWDHPELFASDNMLNNTDNFRFYQTIHIPLIRFIAIQAMQDDGEQLRALVGFSRALDAQYLVVLNDEIDPVFFPAKNLEVLFSNAGFSLIRL